jgi:hypothetical protein
VSRTRPAACCIGVDTGSGWIRTRHPLCRLSLEIVRLDGACDEGGWQGLRPPCPGRSHPALARRLGGSGLLWPGVWGEHRFLGFALQQSLELFPVDRLVLDQNRGDRMEGLTRAQPAAISVSFRSKIGLLAVAQAACLWSVSADGLISRGLATFSMNGLIMSIGAGKTIVVDCEAPSSSSVCR